jgi:hypothetical protein
MQTNDIPIWPNSAIQFSSPDLLKYRVLGSTAIDQITAFYQNETPKQGWITEQEPFLRANQAVLCFRKGTRAITIIVEQVQPDQARVMVRVSRHWSMSSPQGMSCVVEPPV